MYFFRVLQDLLFLILFPLEGTVQFSEFCLSRSTTLCLAHRLTDYYPFKKYVESEFFFLFAVQAWCLLSPCLNDHSYSWVVDLLQLVFNQAGSKQNCRKWMSLSSSLWLFVLIVLNCFKQSPTKTKLAMVRAANQSLRTGRDIMLRHPEEKSILYSTHFLKG